MSTWFAFRKQYAASVGAQHLLSLEPVEGYRAWDEEASTDACVERRQRTTVESSEQYRWLRDASSA